MRDAVKIKPSDQRGMASASDERRLLTSAGPTPSANDDNWFQGASDAGRKNGLRYPPYGAWPALMRSGMAAAYLDEHSETSFLRKVRNGFYPSAFTQGQKRNLKWRREDLDKVVDGASSQSRLLDRM